MRIRLIRHYQNVTGVKLQPGEYDADDPRLQGLAGYLLQTEHAVRVDEPAPVAEDPAEEAAALDFDSMTKSELQSLLDARGIDYPSSARKADLVALLE